MGTPSALPGLGGEAGDQVARGGVARDVAEVGGVRLQRGDAPLERLSGDVDAVRRTAVAGDQQPGRGPLRQALVRSEFGEHPGVVGVADGVDAGQAGRPVVGLVQPGDELDVPGAGDHHVRL